MIGKLLEAFFRHKVLLLLPPFLIPLIVGPIALQMAPEYYESWTAVWVDRAAYFDYTESGDPWATPAQNQTNRLVEMLRTRSFVMDVIRRTPLAPLADSAEGERKVNEIMGRGVSTFTSGRNLMVIRARAETPELAYGLASALVETFRERAAQDRVEQAARAITFYESRLYDAEQRLAQGNEGIRRYVAANPRLTDPLRSTTAAGVSAAVVDPRLMELQRRIQLDQSEVERARQMLDEARLTADSAAEGQEIGFRVVDPARMPRELIRERRRMLMYPAAGLLVGLGLSSVLLVVLVASDRSGRTEHDLTAIGWVVGVVPRLEPQLLPKKAGPDMARRAVGFAAGSALPPPSAAR